MSDLAPPAAAPLWPRVVAVIGLLWSAYGLYLFPLFFEGARAGYISGFEGLGFAISLISGLLGSLCLLFLVRWALGFLAIALLSDLGWAIASDGGFPLRIAMLSALIALLLVAAAFAARRRARGA